MPQLAGVQGAEADSPPPPMRAQGFWPYWLSLSDPATVKNDVELDRMVLLTGPNAAGEARAGGGCPHHHHH